MTDLSQALAEISAIRAQVARGTQFRGYGPASVGASGVLAMTVAAMQSVWLRESARSVGEFLAIWIATATLSVVLSTIETVVRARRVHSGFASAMLRSALEQFLPAAMVGFFLTIVLVRAAPAEVWMLPGLWALCFSLGIFASCRFLPRHMVGVAVWYLVCGLACLTLASGTRVLSAWEMGIPFGVGQLLVAAVLRYGYEESFEDR